VTPGGPIHADVGWQCFAALVTVAVVAPEGSTYMQESRRGANATAGVDVSLAVADNYGDAELGLSRYPSVYQVRGNGGHAGGALTARGALSFLGPTSGLCSSCRGC